MREEVVIDLTDGGKVSGLIDEPYGLECAYVFGHGAGAGMRHSFMEQMAECLAERGIAVLRYQFPAMERGLGRPDSPAVAHATVRAAACMGLNRWPGVPLFAGGKSFGGRMTSQAQALVALEHVMGLVFIGFPLHPAGSPSIKRADHLGGLAVPLLFLQGSRDALAQLELITSVVEALPTAKMAVIEDADHAFHVRRQSGSNDEAVRNRLADIMSEWMKKIGRNSLS